EIGKELLRHPDTLRAFGLGVRRIEENVHACIVEVKMRAGGQGGEATPAYRPNGDQGQQQPVAVLDFALLMTIAGWQREGCVHKLDTVVERMHRGNEAIESVLGPSQTLQARFDRSQPSPVSRRGNQARGGVEVGDSDGDRGRLYLRTE